MNKKRKQQIETAINQLAKINEGVQEINDKLQLHNQHCEMLKEELERLRDEEQEFFDKAPADWADEDESKYKDCEELIDRINSLIDELDKAELDEDEISEVPNGNDVLEVL